ncbi:nervana 1 [Arctopsyche grandis]|uniref:nervana 1 n=1 Tax=Arctopsyche grandis TaxID=121162 RepID=UPI00406D7211
MHAMDKREEKGGINYSFPYMKEANTNTWWENVQLAVYNPNERAFLGRTRKSWAQIIFFYLVFYAGLTALFSICMKGLLSTISETEPKWKLDASLIGTNPGVGFRPLSDRTEEGSLIWYDAKNKTQVTKWVNLINEFLELYLENENIPGGVRNQVQCDFQRRPGDGQVCAVNVGSWAPCTPSANYSYDHSSPCFFLKLNKIYGWVPDFYDDPNDLPEEMPPDLKEYIRNSTAEERRQVWITCSGESPIDKELLGPNGIRYIPTHGLPEYYFPYTNTPGYLSPLIAVQIVRPPLNRIINIECRAWAKNIIYVGSQRDRQGSVHFELMID